MTPCLPHLGVVQENSREFSGDGPPALDTGCRHAPVRVQVWALRVRGLCLELVEGEPDTVSVRRVGHLSAPCEGRVADLARRVFEESLSHRWVGRKRHPRRTEQTR